jgi:threonine dehydrogenase-like Zn-dependent dehydrogenase
VRGGAFGFEPFWPGDGDVQGGQSQYVRVPMADGTLVRVPESLADDVDDARVLPLTDVLTTAYHALVGAELSEGDVLAVLGDGAVGLLACHVARLRSPRAIILAGHHDDRLEVGRRLGATHVVNTRDDDGFAALVAEVTEGLGPEAVIDAVSGAESMKTATEVVQPGGTVSWVGMEVFLGPVEIGWDACFMRNLTIRGGVAPVRRYLPEMLSLLESGRIDPSPVVTQDLPMEEGAAGYAMMAERRPGVVKAVVSPGA